MSQAPAAADTSRSSGYSPLRWWALVLAAVAVSSSYYEDDVIGPIAGLLLRQRGFSQSQLAGRAVLGRAALAPRSGARRPWARRRAQADGGRGVARIHRSTGRMVTLDLVVLAAYPIGGDLSLAGREPSFGVAKN